MIQWGIRLGLRYRAMILVAASAMIIAGALWLPSASVDVLPEFSAPAIQIQTEALGLSAAEVEDLVTLNLEEILASVSWLKTIRSKSITGLSSIILIFEHGTDLMRARQLVQERLNLAHALPNISKSPVMLQPFSTTSRVMIVGLSLKSVSMIDASVLARWTITPKLLGVPGVANVATWGMRSRQLQVQVDPSQLPARDLSLDEVVEAAGDSLWVSPLSYLEASTPGSGGWIDTPNQRLGIQHIQPIISAAELARVPIGDKPVRLGEVAKVVEDHPPLIGDAIVEGRPGLLLVIEKFPNADPQAVARGIDVALSELRQGLPGIDIDPFVYRTTSYITMSIANLKSVMLIAGGVLIVVLAGCFFSWRAVLISIVTILLAFVAAALVLYARGVTINVMVVAGFAIALVVIINDALQDIEVTLRRLHSSSLAEESTAELVVQGCIESRNSAIFVTSILGLAVVPLFLMSGTLGAFLGPLALSCLLALLCSTLVATLVAPTLYVLILRGATARKPTLFEWLRDRYGALLSYVVAAPNAAPAIAGGLALIGIGTLPMLNWSPLPFLKEWEVRASWEAPPGTSLSEMRRVMTRAVKELRLVPGVRKVAAHIGRAVTGDQVVDVESAQFWISIDPRADYKATLGAVGEVVGGYPGLDANVQSYLSDRLSALFAPTRDPIVVRLKGPEREVLQRESDRVAKLLSGVAGIVNPHVERRVEVPQIQIKVDLAAAGRLGLKPGDVRRAAATAFAGLEVGNLFQQQKVFDVIVWSPAESRESITNIRELLLDTDQGHVRLADVAEVRVVPSPKIIEREGVSRLVDIHASIAGRPIVSVADDVKRLLQNTSFPLEYHSILLGNYEEQQARHWWLAISGLGIAIGVYLVLQARWQSWSIASLLVFNMLMALVGGIVAVLIAGGTVSLGSLAGGLSVMGIALRNGVGSVDRYQQLEREAGGDTGAVLRGANERLSSILIGIIGVGAAFIPLLFFGDIAGLELLQPMSVFVVGGLLATAIMDLFVVPGLCLRFARLRPSSPATCMAGQHAQ
jgi:Cu/Ag efflux pump CusA